MFIICYKELKIVSNSIYDPKSDAGESKYSFFIFQVKTHLQFVVVDIKPIKFFIFKKRQEYVYRRKKAADLLYEAVLIYAQ